MVQLRRVIGLTFGIVQVSAVSNTTTDVLNGWYPCSEFTFPETGASTGLRAECATFTAPLCYPGICDSTDSKISEIDIFVKRMPAVGGNPENASNVWILAGGPGRASYYREPIVVDLHTKLNGTANVYTMDHRGTGRSAMLDCVAAQALTSGSPSGGNVDPTEVAACAKALEFKYSDLAAFSITSAATDVAAFISKYTNGASTIVYGVSYGTAVVERLMHLDPPEVTGYVMDSIATASAASADKFEFFSTYERDYGEVGDHFLDLCAQDSVCRSHFAKKNLSDTLVGLLTHFDTNPNSTCATLVSNKASSWLDEKASFKLRATLGMLLATEKFRTLIPPIVYRLNRCSSDDTDVLSNFFDVLNDDSSNPSEGEVYNSDLLYFLIIFSEMWEIPAPSVAEMTARFVSTKLSVGTIYQLAPLYCAFSKDKAKWCEELGLGDYEANAILYERDQYWNKSTTIPSQASVLLLSGKLDPMTAHKYAEYLLDVLEGDNKELVTFDYATHGTVSTTFFSDSDESTDTCGMNIFASYVSSGGDLQRLDKACLDEMPALNLTIPIDNQYTYLGTKDAYDGAFDASLSK